MKNRSPETPIRSLSLLAFGSSRFSYSSLSPRTRKSPRYRIAPPLWAPPVIPAVLPWLWPVTKDMKSLTGKKWLMASSPITCDKQERSKNSLYHHRTFRYYIRKQICRKSEKSSQQFNINFSLLHPKTDFLFWSHERSPFWFLYWSHQSCQETEQNQARPGINLPNSFLSLSLELSIFARPRN